MGDGAMQRIADLLGVFPDVTGRDVDLRAASSSSGALSNSAAESFTLMVPLLASISMMSPSRTSAIGPPTAASGPTWPMQKPRVAPENRPSVISATLPPVPWP